MARTKKVEKVEEKITKKTSAATKVRALETATIEKEIAELKKELFNLRLKAAVGKLENTAQITKTKKQIARMMTVLSERSAAK